MQISNPNGLFLDTGVGIVGSKLAGAGGLAIDGESSICALDAINLQLFAIADNELDIGTIGLIGKQAVFERI